MDVTPGDIVYQIRTVPHRRFERQGDDLYMNLAITLNEAINGFNKKFKHLDGMSIFLFLDFFVVAKLGQEQTESRSRCFLLCFLSISFAGQTHQPTVVHSSQLA